MILKDLDNPAKDLDILNSFLKDDRIPETIKKKIDLEIKKIQSGYKNQQDAAYNINHYYKDTSNYMVIHDLRIEMDNHVAQIDHLVINRILEFAVCESKSFKEGISYNNKLEFTAFYNGKPVGIESPIEQNKRHIEVLKKVFNKNIVELPKRFGFKITPDFLNFILISNKARISHTEGDLPPLTYLIKNESFSTYYDDEKRAEVSQLTKIVSGETIEKLAKNLILLHKPISFNWIDKFGISKFLEENIIVEKEQDQAKKTKNIYHCDVCNEELDSSVVFWCRKNKEKYNKKLLCRNHQPK